MEMNLKKYERLQRQLDRKFNELMTDKSLMKDEDIIYKELVENIYYSKTKKLLQDYFHIEEDY
jgi:hypothetical protein